MLSNATYIRHYFTLYQDIGYLMSLFSTKSIYINSMCSDKVYNRRQFSHVARHVSRRKNLTRCCDDRHWWLL